MRITLLFAGQGAQYPGMGSSLYAYSEKAKEIFDIAGEGIKNWCFRGSKEMLRQTIITQPSIYTVTMAAHAAFIEEIGKLAKDIRKEIEIVAYAGFSLGEYGALTAGGVIDSFEKGLEIVIERGIFMDEAGRDEGGNLLGGMVAAFGSRESIIACVDEVRQNGMLACVNFNSPLQTVVAGDLQALDRFEDQAKSFGIKAIRLSVSTAFHSPLMRKASERLLLLLKNAHLNNPKVEIFSNLSGEKIPFDMGPKELAELMAAQVAAPVYWQEVVENLDYEGADYYIELGPGTTLSGLVKKIIPGAKTLNVEDEESLTKTIQVLSEEIKDDLLGEMS